MSLRTTGIHHITAIVGDPQENYDFYTNVLGLRLVKKTVNFDDPGTYHLYFGNEHGEPGTIITFFPMMSAYQGRIGSGQTGTTAYVVPAGALDFWQERLELFNIKANKVNRFGEDSLQFFDPHGLHLEIVARDGGTKGQSRVKEITNDFAIKGFGGAILLTFNPEGTTTVLKNVFGLNEVARNDQYVRLQSSAELGNVVDVQLTATSRGELGVGTVHHIAWRASTEAELEDWRELIKSEGISSTTVLDRNYFKSVYFREYGGILFEIASDPPGFMVDEDVETLGNDLKLPDWLEPNREAIEGILKPITLRDGKGL